MPWATIGPPADTRCRHPGPPADATRADAVGRSGGPHGRSSPWAAVAVDPVPLTTRHARRPLRIGGRWWGVDAAKVKAGSPPAPVPLAAVAVPVDGCCRWPPAVMLSAMLPAAVDGRRSPAGWDCCRPLRTWDRLSVVPHRCRRSPAGHASGSPLSLLPTTPPGGRRDPLTLPARRCDPFVVGYQ